MYFLGEFLLTLIKYLLLLAVSIGGVLTGKMLREKKTAKK